MIFTSVLGAVATFSLLGVPVLAAQLSNSSQNIIPNAAGDTVLDQTKIAKYKSLLDEFSAGTSADGKKFTQAYQWTNLLDDYAPLSTACSARCLTCAPGCSPACCAQGASLAASDGAGAKSSPDLLIPRFPGGRPMPAPLACPCHCEAGCPRTIQIICCITPPASSLAEPGTVSGVSSDSNPPPSESASAVKPDSQAPLLDKIVSLGTASPSRNHQSLVWGRPNRPLTCPCFCAPTCPAYIQTICCATPGSGLGGSRLSSQGQEIVQEPKTHESLALITKTAEGEVVSVLAAANTTIFDSFITLNLVNGLGRAGQIQHNDALKTFEIVLDVVVGGDGSQKQETVLTQSFTVVGGDQLLEEEQILVGLGFLSRVQGGLKVGEAVVVPAQAGIPVVA